MLPSVTMRPILWRAGTASSYLSTKTSDIVDNEEVLLCERTKGSEIVEDWKGDVINVHEELRFCGGPERFFRR